MMVLQGLDYWIWATANLKALGKADFGVESPGVELDFLVVRNGGKMLSPYSASQSRALDSEVVHQFWEISEWGPGVIPIIEPLGL